METEDFPKEEYPKNESFHVKPIWFQEFAKGNSLWPQTNWGPTLFTLSSVLENSPQTFGEFYTSTLASDQINTIGKMMSHMHHNKGINLATSNLVQKGDIPVYEPRFHNLWSEVKTGVYFQLMDFLGYVGIESREDQKMDDLLDEFLCQDLYPEEKAALRQFTQKAVEALQCQEGIALSKKNRSAYKRQNGLMVEDEPIVIWNETTADALTLVKKATDQVKKDFPVIGNVPLSLLFS